MEKSHEKGIQNSQISIGSTSSTSSTSSTQNTSITTVAPVPPGTNRVEKKKTQEKRPKIFNCIVFG
jgi:hypothetical protein